MLKIKNTLTKETKYLLIVGMLFLAGSNIASVFLNVYLVRLTNSIFIILFQNILNYVSLLIAFIIGTKFISKINLVTFLKTGIFSMIAYYLLILSLKEQAQLFLIPLGIFNGIGQGFYYFSFNLLTGQLVKESEQSRFFSYQQTFSYLFGIIMPSLSGYIISIYTKLTGYYILFFISALLLIIGIYMSIFIKGLTLNQNIRLLEVLKLKGNKYWNANKYYNFSNGIRDSIFNQIFTVFAYTIISNEQIIGQFNSIMACIGIFSSSLIASKFNRTNQKNYHLIASMIYFGIMSLLGIFQSPKILLITYILLGVVYCWNQTIFQSVKFQLAKIANNDYNQYEYIVASEFPIALGRIIGLSISLITCSLFSLNNAYRFLIIFNGTLWLIDHFIINKKVQWLEKEKL